MLISYNLEEIGSIPSQIITNRQQLFCFYGDLGSGKTTMIKSILKHLGFEDLGNSPTFALVNEYHNPHNGDTAFHLDCYRLNSIEEALNTGIEEYLNSNCWVFIEWPEIIEPLLPNKRTEIRINITGMDSRQINLRQLP